MNLEKFTDRAKGFLQAAQTLAIRLNHQRISPEHLLKALLEDEEGMAAGLIQRAGGNPAFATQEVDKALAKVPAVSGSGAQSSPGLDNDAVRVLDAADAPGAKAQSARSAAATVVRIRRVVDIGYSRAGLAERRRHPHGRAARLGWRRRCRASARRRRRRFGR